MMDNTGLLTGSLRDKRKKEREESQNERGEEKVNPARTQMFCLFVCLFLLLLFFFSPTRRT